MPRYQLDLVKKILLRWNVVPIVFLFLLIPVLFMIIGGSYFAKSIIDSIRVIILPYKLSSWLSYSNNNIVNYPVVFFSMKFSPTYSNIVPITTGMIFSQALLGLLSALNINALMDFLQKRREACGVDIRKTTSGVGMAGAGSIIGLQLTAIVGGCSTCFGIIAATTLASTGSVGILASIAPYSWAIKSAGALILLVNLVFLVKKLTQAGGEGERN